MVDPIVVDIWSTCPQRVNISECQKIMKNEEAASRLGLRPRLGGWGWKHSELYTNNVVFRHCLNKANQKVSHIYTSCRGICWGGATETQLKADWPLEWPLPCQSWIKNISLANDNVWIMAPLLPRLKNILQSPGLYDLLLMEGDLFGTKERFPTSTLEVQHSRARMTNRRTQWSSPLPLQNVGEQSVYLERPAILKASKTNVIRQCLQNAKLQLILVKPVGLFLIYVWSCARS